MSTFTPKRSHGAFVVGAIFGLSLWFSPGGRAQAPSPTVNASASPLVISDAPDANGNSPGDTFDFGTLDPLTLRLDLPKEQQDGVPRRDHIFWIKNRSTTALTLAKPRLSCSCMVVTLLTPDGKERPFQKSPFPATLAAGERVGMRISVGIDPARVSERLSEQVWLYDDAGRGPLLRLSLIGRLRRIAAFSPQTLELGEIKVPDATSPSTTPSMPVAGTLTLYVDPRLLAESSPATNQLPALRSDNPYLRVSGPRPGPRGAASSLINGASGDYDSFVYTVTVAPDAPVGILYAQFHFAPATKSLSPVDSLLSTTWAAAACRRRGRFAFAEEAVAFGLVPAGETRTREIEIRATIPDATKPGNTTIIRLQSDNPLITSQIVPSTAANDSRLRVRVSLSSKATPGPVHARVIVLLSNGERLLLPIHGIVLQARPPQTRP